ncbi:hypothetical protein NA56DRAFT_642503 [Hyaloscypha hepaticicola]|uniref:Uncharacterized protein n=1 Tax=Hyaloscypha hepaticicola TaxID=2082293 RepID=A0A2J6QGW9_9HELO|nr:hypothetical protein NA56DRAFT_642503 [Hyaloscypha hepaticicola]
MLMAMLESPSALHTLDAIESRYIKVFLKWDDADEQMRFAARTTYQAGKQFRIGAVVDHIKKTFFSTDPSTTEAHIQARYCRRFLGIENTVEAVQKYDDRRVAQEWSVPRREGRPSRPANRPNPAMQPAQVHSPIPFSTAEPLARRQETPQPSTVQMQGPVSGPVFLRATRLPPISPPCTMLMQETLSGPASLRAHRLPPTSPSSSTRYPSAPSSVNSHKRLRQNSFDSSSSMAPSQYSGRSNYTNFSHPQLNRVEMHFRDSGFFSNSSGSDTTSLLSRMSRLSIEVKLCEMDHTGMGPGNPCPICRYPEPRPKPRVYVAPEYVAPQRADVVDRDDMDNGVMTRNADEGI